MTNPDCTTCAYAVRDMAMIACQQAPIYCVWLGVYPTLPSKRRTGCNWHQSCLDHEPVRKDRAHE